jgi:hypothetical protein
MFCLFLVQRKVSSISEVLNIFYFDCNSHGVQVQFNYLTVTSDLHFTTFYLFLLRHMCRPGNLRSE